MYTVKLKPQVQKFIEAQRPKIQRQLIGRIENLAQNPRPQDSKLLNSQKQIYRIRSGNYRIIYQVQDKKLLVLVAKADDRKNVYKNLTCTLKSFFDSHTVL